MDPLSVLCLRVCVCVSHLISIPDLVSILLPVAPPPFLCASHYLCRCRNLSPSFQNVHPVFGAGQRERVTLREGVQRVWFTRGEWDGDILLPEVALCVQEVARGEDIWLLKVAWVRMPQSGGAQDGVHGSALGGRQRRGDPHGHQQEVAPSIMVSSQLIASFILFTLYGWWQKCLTNSASCV